MNRWRAALLFLLPSAFLCWAQSPLTLQQALEESLQKNQSLLASKEQSRAVALDRWSNWLPANPELFMEMEGMPSSTGVDDWGERKIGFVQPLHFPTVYITAAAQSKALAEAAGWQHAEKCNETAAQVKIVFYSVLAAKEILELKQEMCHRAQVYLEKARLRVTAGETSIIDSLRARVQLTEARQARLQAMKRLDLEQGRLSVLLGRSAEADISITGSLKVDSQPVELTRIIRQAQAETPVVAGQKARSRALDADKAMAWQSLLPDFSVKAFKREFNDSGAKDYGLELGMQVPLWFFAREQSAIRAAAARSKAGQYETRALQKNVDMAIRKAHADLILAEDTAMKISQYSLDEAEALAGLTQRSYDAGEASYLALIESFNTLSRVKLRHIEAQLNVFTARAALEQAAGSTLFNW